MRINQLQNQPKDHLCSLLNDHLGIKWIQSATIPLKNPPWGKLGSQLWDQLGGQLREQLFGQLWDELSTQSRGPLWDRLWE